MSTLKFHQLLHINVLHDGKVTKIGKHDYYQIGTNQYVKVVNTALK